MKTIKVTQVFMKEGATNKGGKTFAWKRYGLKDENGVWYSCFQKEFDAIADYNGLATIKEGDTIEIEVTEEEYNGKTQFRANAPDKTTLLVNEINILKDRVSKLEALVRGSKPSVSAPNLKPIEAYADDSDIPF